jgi:magnesium chelatase subunit H
MQKPISDADNGGLRVVIITLDNHLASATDRARLALQRDIQGMSLGFHAAADWDHEPRALQSCIDDIGKAHIIIMTMLFMEEHVNMVLPALQARRDHCDAIVGCMSASEIVKLTRLGRFNMDGTKRGALDFLKKLRGSKKPEETGGARQMAMLRRLPRILRFIPGPAQDVRAYFLTLQYWLGSSDENVANLVRLLASRYASGAHARLRKTLKAPLPIEYPEVGVYHPRMPGRVAENADRLPKVSGKQRGVVGLLLMRSYILANNTAHYDAVIAGFEARGLSVIPAFASGLDARPAAANFFMKAGAPMIDALVSLTGFSLVGGPAYNDSKSAVDILAALDVPYVAAHALEFQTIEQWEDSERGLSPVEATLMIAIPELDGATVPMVFGGRSSRSSSSNARDMVPHIERVNRLTDRVDRLVTLRKTPKADRKTAVVLFNFPPNAGATGTAAFLSVFESLHNTLLAMKSEGYDVDVPESVDALRTRILGGNASRFGADANVHARISVEDHVRREPWLREVEAQWGPAPGRQQSDGSSIFVLGERFGNVFVGIQPAFGYEGDPMRLLFERNFAPTHAFVAFYRYLRDDFGAHAVMHFGTHGALEFMPGKQTGASATCWPDRLIGALPNIYLYAANNPSEGAIAKRRSAATLVSYLTPSLAQAGLYRGLLDLKASIERFRALEPDATTERTQLAELIQTQASELDLAAADPQWSGDLEGRILALNTAILEVEYSLIPHGLHVAGEAASASERMDTLQAIAENTHHIEGARTGIEAMVNGASVEAALAKSGLSKDAATLDAFSELARLNALLAQDHEIPALLRALDGRFIQPVAGGDLLRTPSILPTGRNLHGFDPYRIPSAFAVADGARQAQRVLDRYQADGNALPRSIAVVLWGTDNLKSEGSAIAQVLAMIGALPRFDGFGRLCGASLIPLEQLGRPRIDVVVTLSGIFRDLLPLQTKLLAEAFYLAAIADEPAGMNFVREHALADQALHGIDIETAALRVFSNAEGAYGSNVGMLIDSSAWSDGDEISETYSRRKCFAYGRKGQPAAQPALMQSLLQTVDFAYQNLDSVELGVTTIDQYFDSLGGMGRSVTRARGGRVAPVYISDQTRGEGKVRSLTEQVALETRSRILNPKWYEGMLKHGYEGVRQIEAHVTNTMGWSATTGQVDPWVYEQITRTYVLDPAMRQRMAALNPVASAKMANRIIEAHQRGFWKPEASLLQALQSAGEELEDRLEGVAAEIAA